MIKVFVWLTFHDKLMTSKRQSRILGTSAECHRCRGVPESQIPVLRDCAVASRTWTRLISPHNIQNFFKAPFKLWLRWNLTSKLGRNPEDSWITLFMVARFVANLGNCTTFQADIWGIYYALTTTWELGLRTVIVETDSKAVYEIMIQEDKRKKHPNSVIRKINNWVKRQWKVQFRHNLREGNTVADWLAKKSLKTDPEYHFIDIPPAKIRNLLFDDCRGVAIPHLVSTL
ncbi:hypothetical protein AHAS_Ahas16G0234400 [Arachis hypogaea]